MKGKESSFIFSKSPISACGGLAQSEECALCKREAPGSKPGFSICWSYSVMVITLDFESSNPGSNPGRTFFFLYHQKKTLYSLCFCYHVNKFKNTFFLEGSPWPNG